MSPARLYLNVGNTSLQWGVWDAGGWAAEGRITIAEPTAALEELAVAVAEQGLTGEVVVVTSRRDLDDWRAKAEGALGRRLVVMGRDFSVTIPTRYRDPAQWGQDRVANVIAARGQDLYPCLILDAGTCLTADVLDEEGLHLGGAIAAGGPALMTGTAGRAPHLLRFIQRMGAANDSEDWGLNTAENLRLGWELGLCGIMEALVARYWEVTDPEGEVILTGGDAEFLAAGLGYPVMVRPRLTLEGLRLAWEEAREADGPS